MNNNKNYYKDIYFDPEYGILNELIEDGISKTFKFKSVDGVISNTFIKRKIHILINNKQYYDIITPYGYGGPVILELNGNKEVLIEEYYKAFSEYCFTENIVSEFIRFHPIIENAKDFKNIYNVNYNRNTVCTHLENVENPFSQEFSKSAKKTTNRSLRDGVTFSFVENITLKALTDFYDIYIETMKRNSGEEFYLFPFEYFKDIINRFKENVLIINALYEEEVIASELYFVYNGYIHAHLSGTKDGMLHLSPSNVINYAITIWGKENNMKLIHHGGGLTSDPNDSLFRFKKRFGKNEDYSFYVGTKVWNEEIYDELNRITNNFNVVDYFPKYRYSKGE